MPDPDKFYITTTLPYINAKLHLGHALELIRADVVARHKQGLGFEVFFNTGTDEHGLKIYRKAQEEGLDPQSYVDKHAQSFKQLIQDLGLLSTVNIIRTTDDHHLKSAQEFWRRCQEAGYIYKAKYKTLYCVGCELEKTSSDLVNGECPDHPGLPLEEREEENYFFRFSDFQEPLLELYRKQSDFVVPDFRQREVAAFVERGLNDFSISRLKSKLPWGVPVPGDPDQVMYVWFDALVNYISAIGWPESASGEVEDGDQFDRWWPVTQYAGKDNLRQQSAMWQAMLLSVGLQPSRQIVINGFVISGGQKMSKTLGNVLDPYQLIDEFGVEALRYFVCRELHPFEDSDVSLDKFKESYNANLANGLGNLVARITKMAETHLSSPVKPSKTDLDQGYLEAFESFNLQQVSDLVWAKISDLDGRIQETQPFKLIKTDPEQAKAIISELATDLYSVAEMLSPIMPETSKVIKDSVLSNRKPPTLFARK